MDLRLPVSSPLRIRVAVFFVSHTIRAEAGIGCSDRQTTAYLSLNAPDELIPVFSGNEVREHS